MHNKHNKRSTCRHVGLFADLIGECVLFRFSSKCQITRLFYSPRYFEAISVSCSTLSSLVRSGQARVCVPLIDANEAPLSAEEEEKREQKAARTAAWNESCALFTSFQTPADGHDDDNGDEDERASFSFVCVKSRGGRRGWRKTVSISI